MSFLSSFMIPFLICLIFAYALTHKVDLVSAFSPGVCDGLKIVLNMFPALLASYPDYQRLSAPPALCSFCPGLWRLLLPLWGFPLQFFPLPCFVPSQAAVRWLSLKIS